MDKNHALARYSARSEFCSRAILDDANGLQCGAEKKRRSRAGIADHNARFDALPMEEQRLHARAAEDVRKRKVREQEAARQGIRDALATLLADDEAARGQRQGICNQLSSCRLSDDELLTMCKIYEEFAAGRQRPPLFLRAPTIPDADLQGFIEEKAKDLCGPWRPLVSPGGVLQRAIYKERKHFVDTCFASESHLCVFACDAEPTGHCVPEVLSQRGPLGVWPARLHWRRSRVCDWHAVVRRARGCIHAACFAPR